MGGDEVDRNAWATCPSVIAWAANEGCAHGIANCVTDWWYTSMYNFLHAPPYNRQVFAWEDATDAVNASWAGASTGGLVLEQWNGSPDEWRSGVCDIARSSNAGVLVSGPFSDVLSPPGKDYGAIPYNSYPEKNYADLYNLTCNVTARLEQQIVGPELMFWDDAGDISASDIVLMLMSSLPPVAEGGWSPQSVTTSGTVNPLRYQDFRCRMASRGMHSHDACKLAPNRTAHGVPPE